MCRLGRNYFLTFFIHNKIDLFHKFKCAKSFTKTDLSRVARREPFIVVCIQIQCRLRELKLY